MAQYSLKESFRNHFGFLLHQFGFSLAEERYHQEMGNAIIVFAKPPALIEVVKDRCQILAVLGDERLSRNEWIEFALAVQFLAGSTVPVYSFPSTHNDETEDSQVAHVSALLRQHCTPILSGELTVVQLKEVMQARHQQELRDFFASFHTSSDSESST